MNRRTLLRGAAATLAVPLADVRAGTPHAAKATSALQVAAEEFGRLSPGQAAVCLSVRDSHAARTYRVLADKPLFVGSAVKTFMLGQYLKEVEAGRLSESTQLDVGPAIWSPGSPVFMHLQGTTAATSLLEAMIAHSDNTATDAILKAVGPDRVRQLIASLGYAHTRIPDSTRMLFSYLAGAPEGTDLGWDGMQKMATGSMPGKPRDPMNERQTMQSTATEMSGWYEHVLAGKLFRKPETLQEFKRISAMANAMPMMAPEDTPAYGKGGSIDWEDFHCFSVAGQMVQPGRRSSFCFIVNWRGSDDSVPRMMADFKSRGQRILRLAAQS
ncbi:class A beta-lactamase-related serine hydrolase [Candidimonas humi]|uniref:beta-lactamase n=1 Tax=Candidimonas humi TaxID=683355 RepID=A0ABV8P6W1_9BURK|nr:serine hydrolase [Candidimonas humi]MBV6307173.1 class A beta-lactamase-related serine hydrolase [Candidimonas humi]